jgi:hypothetical protein
VEWWGEGRPAFVSPRGVAHFEGRWQPPAPAERAAEALVESNRARGIDPGWRTAGARWKREADIPGRVYFRAMEAAG